MPSLTLANSLRATITYSPFSPASLFTDGAPGVWYDPSDYTTLFQDSAGTTPVTAVEQPVGLMLDKSQGLVLGPELVSNPGPFTATTGWVPQTGIILSTSSNRLVVDMTGGSSLARAATSISCVIGLTYRFTLIIQRRNGSTGATRVLVGPNSGLTSAVFASSDVSSTGVDETVTAVFTATATTMWVGISNSAFNAVIEIASASAKLLPGNHAFQSTSASRPVLSARYNLLTKTEEFDNAVWTKTDVTVASGFTDSVGTSKAWKLQENSANANHLISISPTGVSSTTNRWSVEVKAGERNYVLLFGAGIGGAYFNLTDGTSVNYSTAPDNKGSVNLGNGWWRIWIEKNAIPSNCQLYTSDTGSRFVYQGTAGSGIYFAFPDLRPTNQSTLPYQRVNTSTDYATTGFLPYLKFDGVDDSMSTNSINFTSTDKISAFAGARKLSNTAYELLYETSIRPDLNNGAFGCFATDGTSGTYGFNLRGTSGVYYVPTGYTAPITSVLSCLNDIGGASLATELIPRINGALAQVGGGGTTAGTGNFGNYPLFIGRRNNATNPFNGQLYSMIIVGKQVTATELSSTETYTAIKTGVTLA